MIRDHTKQALKWIIEILNKHNIPYALTGGFAAKLYGSTREINDIDIDIPENKFEEIIEDVKHYIVEDPEDYKDEKWDLKVMTLKYLGQDIDIGGANNTKIFNEEKNIWISYPTNLENTIDYKIDELAVKVVNPYELINYKKALISKNYPSSHQIDDIKAIEEYLAKT